MLQQLLPADVFAAALIFVRVGAALMLLPGFGEFYVMSRFRLLLAVLVSALLTPVLGPSLPPLPAGVPALAAMIASEAVIGLFLGSVTRILLGALDVAGTVVSLQLGLSAAQIFNPMVASTSPLLSSLYGVMGVLMIFLTDLHLLLLRALVDSYNVFPPGVMPPVEDLANLIARSVAAAFLIGMEMSAPFILLGLLFFAVVGIIGRLVPQLHILFVTQPLQITGGLLAMVFLLAASMRFFLDAFIGQFTQLTGG